jgi:hypothetical protein
VYNARNNIGLISLDPRRNHRGYIRFRQDFASADRSQAKQLLLAPISRTSGSRQKVAVTLIVSIASRSLALLAGIILRRPDRGRWRAAMLLLAGRNSCS